MTIELKTKKMDMTADEWEETVVTSVAMVKAVKVTEVQAAFLLEQLPTLALRRAMAAFPWEEAQGGWLAAALHFPRVPW